MDGHLLALFVTALNLARGAGTPHPETSKHVTKEADLDFSPF